MSVIDTNALKLSLKRQKAMPPTLRMPAWRWAFVVSTHLDRDIKLTTLSCDKLTQEWAGWYRRYMDGSDKGTKLDRCCETAYNIYNTRRPGSIRWIIEAMLVSGEDPVAIASHFTDIDHVVIQRYSDMFMDVSGIQNNKHERISVVLSWCTKAEHDMLWKMYSIENGVEKLIRMVSSPGMVASDIRWYRNIVQKRVATAGATGGMGTWDESVERIMTSAGKWLGTEEPDAGKDADIKVMDFLSRLTVQLKKHDTPGDAREHVPIPFKGKKTA